jgi:hypothetical protein
MTHVHKYKKKFIGKNKYCVYMCVIPRCTHYIQPDLLEGKEAICWRCEKSFIVSRSNTNLSPSRCTQKPICIDCKRRKNKSAIEQISIEDIMKIVQEN